jgi:cell division protein YceG involved in septum cleavage
MNQQTPARRTLIAAVLILGVCAWIIVGGVVLMDTILVVPTPTAIRVSIKPTVTPPATTAPIEITATDIPTATPRTLAIVPTVDTPTPTAAPATAEIAPITANGCKTPAGWGAYTIEDGDTLFGFSLGSKGQLSVNDIMAGNCLQTKLLSVGQTIFLPQGVAENSPKVDSGPADSAAALPAGLSRTAKCPCTITIRAGLRMEQVAAAVDAVPVGFTGADFLKTVAPGAPVPDLAFLQSRPAGKSLEGFLFPGTYTLDNTTSAVQFRDMMLNAFGANVGAQVQADATANGLTFWQAITLASIVQRESGAASEQKLIASVFYNRLAANKGLAASVTLQYALGHPGNWWPRLTAGTVNMQSPYNTNLNAGLPPSPIASPSLGAILATIYPAKTDYQFFSAKCSGGGNFYASTYEEFKLGLKCN